MKECWMPENIILAMAGIFSIFLAANIIYNQIDLLTAISL